MYALLLIVLQSLFWNLHETRNHLEFKANKKELFGKIFKILFFHVYLGNYPLI